MKQIDYLTLLRGSPVAVGDILVYPPTLDDISRIGLEQYEAFLSILLISVDDFAKIFRDGGFDDFHQITRFQLLTMIPELREAFLSSLRFFLRKNVFYDTDVGYVLRDESGSDQYMSFQILSEIRSDILQLCNISDSSADKPTKFRNEKDRERYERHQMKKEKAMKMSKKTHADLSMTLPNLISAVSGFHGPYDLTNIWGLTVFQFYDQFARLDGNIQLDVMSHRWAAWGEDAFDFSMWRKPTHQ